MSPVGERREWLEVRLDQAHRRTAAESIESFASQLEEDEATSFLRLARLLRVGRDEFLLDHDQAHDLLTSLDESSRLSTLRARLRAFIDEG